jgi:tetratricopeptide (TPR) repeat protein
MSRQASPAASELSLEHFSYEALQHAEWKHFERFTVDVLQRYYKRFGLSMVRTIKSAGSDIGGDGAHDGEGTVLFGGENSNQGSFIAPSLVRRDLSVLITLWVEVKQRSRRNVNHHDVGGTIFRSSLEYVSKIIFVSNRGFTRQFIADLERFAIRNGRQFSLIDGKTLIQIAEQVLNTGSNKSGHDERPLRPKSSQIINTKLLFALDPALRYSETSAGKLEHWLNEPVFVVANCHTDPSAQPFDFLSLDLEYVGPVKVTITARSGSKQAAVGAEDHFRAVFTVFASEPLELSLKSFNLRITDRDGRPLKTKITRSRDNCVVHGTILPNWIPPSKTQIHECIRKTIEGWGRSGGNQSADVHAIAGAGKSHLIREIRRTWLGLGAYEIFLDGGREQTANATALSLLSQVFPIPIDEVTTELSATLAEWLKRSGLTEDSATALARHVSSQSDETELPFNISQLGHFLALILAKRSQIDPVIVVFEDLHKCLPSAIALLRALRSSLTDLGWGRLFTLFSTREDSVWDDDAVRTEWRNSMERMRVSNDVPQFRLTAFSPKEALALIVESIPTIEEHYASAIIEQVGTTPFALREALGFLIETRILEPANRNGEWRLTNAEALLRTIDSQRLRQATHYRLLGLKERHPEWVADFIDSGACLGYSFDLDACARSIHITSQKALEKALAECRALEIMRFSMVAPTQLQFDHDLIRRVLLEEMGPARQRRLARTLLETLAGSHNEAILASLAYQAGLGDDCWKHSVRQADAAGRAKRHMEAVHAIGLALTVTDQNVVSKIFNVPSGRYRPSFDEAIAVAEPCLRANLSRAERELETAELLLRYVEHLVAVGSGGSPSIDQALTEGEMLAERRKDLALRATLKTYHGRQEFNRDRPYKSLELHQAAEAMFASLEPTPEIGRRRSQNLVRLAIALRQTGQLEESRRELIQVLKKRQSPDWSLATQVRANFGATYFHLDWSETRRHWSRALRIAELRQLPDRKVHSLIDVANLDLLEDKNESAVRKLEYALVLSKDYGLENSELRCLLNLGCEALMRGDALQALDHLRQADRLGFRHGIGRRLWRVRANMATAYFVLGDIQKSLTTDKIMLASMTPVEGQMSLDGPQSFSKTRMILALANVELRARSCEHYKETLPDIPDTILRVAKEFASAVVNDRLDLLPGLRGRHCKKIGGKRFFVVTE